MFHQVLPCGQVCGKGCGKEGLLGLVRWKIYARGRLLIVRDLNRMLCPAHGSHVVLCLWTPDKCMAICACAGYTISNRAEP